MTSFQGVADLSAAGAVSLMHDGRRRPGLRRDSKWLGRPGAGVIAGSTRNGWDGRGSSPAPGDDTAELLMRSAEQAAPRDSEFSDNRKPWGDGRYTRLTKQT